MKKKNGGKKNRPGYNAGAVSGIADQAGIIPL
jgi:hypothetical protein